MSISIFLDRKGPNQQQVIVRSRVSFAEFKNAADAFYSGASASNSFSSVRSAEGLLVLEDVAVEVSEILYLEERNAASLPLPASLFELAQQIVDFDTSEAKWPNSARQLAHQLLELRA